MNSLVQFKLWFKENPVFLVCRKVPVLLININIKVLQARYQYLLDQLLNCIFKHTIESTLLTTLVGKTYYINNFYEYTQTVLFYSQFVKRISLNEFLMLTLFASMFLFCVWEAAFIVCSECVFLYYHTHLRVVTN